MRIPCHPINVLLLDSRHGKTRMCVHLYHRHLLQKKIGRHEGGTYISVTLRGAENIIFVQHNTSRDKAKAC